VSDSKVITAAARFVLPTNTDDNGIVLQRFMRCHASCDLSRGDFAAYIAGMIGEQATQNGEITADHVCVFVGVREVVKDEIEPLIPSMRQREVTQ